MKVIRKLTLPGRREFESSSWEIELDINDIPMEALPINNPMDVVRALHELSRIAQARVLVNMVHEGLMTSDEMSQRLAPFMDDLPDWLLGKKAG